MAGLELITDRIIRDAEKKAEQIYKKAEDNIRDIQEEYGAEIEKVKARSNDDIEAAKKREEERFFAELRAKRREAVLEAKNEAIESIIAEAKKRILSMPDDEYFDVLASIYAACAEDGDGEILFSKKDKSRISEEFIKRLCKIKGNVVLSKEDAPSEGFIIRYGRVEENCTIDAVFEDKYNKLADIVNMCCKE